MNQYLNLPTLPAIDALRTVVLLMRAVADHYERQQPLSNRARSLSHERNILHNKLYDILIENAMELMELGILDQIQDVVSDLISNEIENVELLIEMNTETIRMAQEVKHTANE